MSIDCSVLSQIRLIDLEAMIVVAESGSFRGAAARLHMGQPALSRRIRRLEDVLGLSLFERCTTGARLTEGGKCFVAGARQLLVDFDVVASATQMHGTAARGSLRVGLVVSLAQGVLRDLFARLIADQPEIEVSISELDRSELLTLLSHREIDVVVAAGEPEPEFGDGLLLQRACIYLAVAADHPFADRDRLFWEDVSCASFIVSASDPGPEIHDYITRNATGLGHQASVRRFRVGREGIMNLVGLGFGVSLVADHCRGVCYPNVTFIPIGDEDERVPFSLTWRPENDNPALRRFLSLARVEAKKAASSPSAPSRTPDPSP